MNKSSKLSIIPVMLCFFAMGFVDLVGIASNYVKEDGTPIEEEKDSGSASGFSDCFKLFGKPIVLLSFIGIMCHVGIDVGTNTTAPKILMERLGWSLNDAAFATSLYFIFRTIGCFTGTAFLRMMKTRIFFIISVVMMALSMVFMFIGDNKTMLYIAIALVGYGNSNVFSMILSQALLALPEKKNETLEVSE